MVSIASFRFSAALSAGCGLALFALAGCGPQAGTTSVRPQTAAVQSDHQQSVTGENTRFSYAFQDHGGVDRQIAFALPTHEVAAAIAGFRAFDAGAVDARFQAAYREQLLEEIDTLRPAYPNADIFLNDRNEIRYRVNSLSKDRIVHAEAFDYLDQAALDLTVDYPYLRFYIDETDTLFKFEIDGEPDDADADAIEDAMTAAVKEAEALQRRLFAEGDTAAGQRMVALTTELEDSIAVARERARVEARAAINEQGYAPTDETTLFVLPDYAAIAREGASGLDGAVAAFRGLVAGLDRRAAVNRILAFFQAIPYDELTTRNGAQAGAGFALPIALFGRNEGDCDTKSVAMAAVLHRLYPDLPISMIVLEGHALLALGLARGANDALIYTDGRDWVLAEPTGPAALPLGQVASLSTQGLSGDFRVLDLF